MDDKFTSLITWFNLLEAAAPHSSVSELSDGVAMAQVLSQIDPDYFPSSWCAKIKTNVENNWRVKVSNMKKIIERVTDYCTDILNLNLVDYKTPDALKIGEGGNLDELGRLLQLILGCAVNCERKQTYITQIMCLEEACQRNIMCAIQELEALTPIRGRGPKSLINEFELNKLEALVEERDQLAQRCHDLDRQVACLTDEKLSIASELQKMQRQFKHHDSPILDADGQSLGPVVEGSARYNEMRRQLDIYKEDLFKAETAREDLKLKSIQQEKELIVLKNKVDELQDSALEISRLKDEMDALRETNEQLKSYESTIQSYKKKLEDHADLKRQLKILEERNTEYMQKNMQLEDNIKKQSTFRPQIEVYKKQLSDALTKLDAEILKSDRLEFENTDLKTKLSALQRERDNLLSERDLLKETCEELQCENNPKTDEGNTMSKELMSPAIKERLEQLEADNRMLREEEGDIAAMQVLLDDANLRIDQLRNQLREANQRALKMNSLVNENASFREMDPDLKLKQTSELEQKNQQLEEAFLQMASYRRKITALQEALTQKDSEVSGAEEKYRRCIEKAKEVIKSLDPKNANFSLMSSSPKQASVELEAKLIMSAYHRLGLVCHREAIDQRFVQISQSQSFLSRQRQAACRKPIGNYKK